MKDNSQILDEATYKIFGDGFTFDELCRQYLKSKGILPSTHCLFRVIEIAMIDYHKYKLTENESSI